VTTGLPGRPAPTRRLADSDRAALEVWSVSRLGMIVVAWAAGWMFIEFASAPGPWLDRWNRWDTVIFVEISQKGYFGPGTDPNDIAFFPGVPRLLGVVQLVVRNWVASGLLISLIAGGVAVVALGRLAVDSLPEGVRARDAAGNTALVFVLAPPAVFLAAGYSESLFAAFAFTAWYAARRSRWVLAVLLAAAASTVRINGLFLAAAVALEFLLAGRARRRWSQLPLLVLPVLPVLGYVIYLHDRTGDWMAWQHAQAAGWLRTFSDPLSAWTLTWGAAFGRTQDGHTAWTFQLELLAVLVGIGLTVWLAALRRWPETLYVALSLLALGTTTWFMSVPRAMLLWWPLWIGLGNWAARRPVVRTLYVCCVSPVMVAVAVLFLSGRWAG
jgi:hypothetical protein